MLLSVQSNVADSQIDPSSIQNTVKPPNSGHPK